MDVRIFLLLFFFIFNNICGSAGKCEFSTCGECISSALDHCVWCAQDDMAPEHHRCIPYSEVNTKKNWCAKSYIKLSHPEKKVTMNKSFNETISGVRVQLRPQHIKVKARPGHTTNFTMFYEPAEDYALDVYYVMDISFSMTQHKRDLRNQAVEIYEKLTSYTNNVRLGIGSFVEKPGFPYVDEIKGHKSYSFKNDLSLTKDMDEFKSTIDKIQFGANFDKPEAGLDALMQAMMCEKQVGWRDDARRIIVLCTDSTYHSAGDGKIVGAIVPNDMKCHLDNNLYYNKTMSLIYDYPSVSQINKVAAKGHFLIVFAAKKSVATEYTRLASQILGAKYAVLEGGKDTVEIIKKAYTENAVKIELYYDLPPFIQLTVDQNCKTKPTRNCESTAEQRTVSIAGNLTVTYCPPDGVYKRELVIKAVGINDNVTIELEIDCKCDCEKIITYISPKCHDAGALQCGICKCNLGRYGNDCRCNGTSTDTLDMEKCKLPEDDILCSGRGTCRCGKCEECKPGFSGEYCQYDDNSCPSVNRKLCSGYGTCRLGRCQCDAGWTSEDCSCTQNINPCIAPYSKELCSGNGICECGICICNNLSDKNGTYTGSYCDACDDCAEKRCKELEGYVVCNVMKTKIVCDEERNYTNSNNATNTIVTFLNKTELNGPDWYLAKICKARLENDSTVIFKYRYTDGSIELGIQNEAELPPKADIFIAVGSAIGFVLLIGVLTIIIWKILVDLHDKREFQKFANESKAAGYDISQNPLYTPPGTHFSNPAYECN